MRNLGKISQISKNGGHVIFRLDITHSKEARQKFKGM